MLPCVMGAHITEEAQENAIRNVNNICCHPVGYQLINNSINIMQVALLAAQTMSPM